MPLIHFRNVLSCSSEDRVHCAENLLKPEQYKKWLSSKGGEERITAILELEKSTVISSVDVGNDGSAFIELFVARSSSNKPDDWTVLLPATLLMTPNESRSNTNRNQVKLLTINDLNKTCANEKWDRMKIVCEQKFNRLNPFGLCFLKLYSSSDDMNTTNPPISLKTSSSTVDDDDEDETGKEQSKIGSFFAKKQAEKKTSTSASTTPSASDKIRALSNVADELLTKKSMNDHDIQTLLKKEVKNSPARKSKRPISDDEEPTTSTNNEVKRSKEKPESKEQLMKNVVFVLSGFKNPLRSELRNKATSMGALYKDDWDKTCTHLICAFSNTPKMTQVQQTGHGKIVGQEWILACYEQGKLLPWKVYEMKASAVTASSTTRDTPKRASEKKPNAEAASSTTRDTPKRTSEKKPIAEATSSTTRGTPKRASEKKPKTKMLTFDDDDEEEEEPIVSKDVEPKPTLPKVTTFDDDTDEYGADTDEDEPTTSNNQVELPDFFHDKHFYASNLEFNETTLHDIRRIIHAYDGILEKQPNTNVKYLITNRKWNNDFEKTSKAHPELSFVTLAWLQACHDRNKFVPCQAYLVIP